MLAGSVLFCFFCIIPLYMTEFVWEEPEWIKPFGLSVWHEFSGLARKVGSVNLGQGFPGWHPQDFIIEAVEQVPFECVRNAYVTGSPRQDPEHNTSKCCPHTPIRKAQRASKIVCCCSQIILRPHWQTVEP